MRERRVRLERVCVQVWMAIVIVGATADARAQEAEAASGPTFGGLVDGYVSLQPDRGPLQGTQLRAFDGVANEIALSYAELTVDQAPAPVGFRLDLAFGPTADIVNSPDALAGYDPLSHVQQAFVAWKPGERWTLRLGRAVTQHGFEVIESNANWNYSRSLLFTWAIPFTHTGVSATYSPSDAVDLTVFYVNGLNNAIDHNSFKSPGLQILARPSDRSLLAFSYNAFNEQPGHDGRWVSWDHALHLFDVVAVFSPAPFDLGLNVDVGHDLAVDGDRTFYGAAGYVQWAASERTKLGLRAEVLRDSASETLGVLGVDDGHVFETTSTVSFAPADGLLLRVEGRLDQGLGGYEPFTGRDGDASASATTLSFSGVGSF